jgi:hypothetical protein
MVMYSACFASSVAAYPTDNKEIVKNLIFSASRHSVNNWAL